MCFCIKRIHRSESRAEKIRSNLLSAGLGINTMSGASLFSLLFPTPQAHFCVFIQSINIYLGLSLCVCSPWIWISSPLAIYAPLSFCIILCFFPFAFFLFLSLTYKSNSLNSITGFQQQNRQRCTVARLKNTNLLLLLLIYCYYSFSVVLNMDHMDITTETFNFSV